MKNLFLIGALSFGALFGLVACDSPEEDVEEELEELQDEKEDVAEEAAEAADE